MYRLSVLVVCTTAIFMATTVHSADLCATATCLSNGDTPCDRTVSTCPPCIYAISGGYSCYAKESGACPYAETIVICDAKTTTPSVDTSKTLTLSSMTLAPEVSGPTGTSGTTAPDISSIALMLTKTSNDTVATPSPVPGSAPVPDANSVPPAAAPVPETKAPLVAKNIQNTHGETNQSKSSSAINIAIVCAAVAGVLAVVVFVVRRLKKQRESSFLKDLEANTPINQGFPLQELHSSTSIDHKPGSVKLNTNDLKVSQPAHKPVYMKPSSNTFAGGDISFCSEFSNIAVLPPQSENREYQLSTSHLVSPPRLLAGIKEKPSNTPSIQHNPASIHRLYPELYGDYSSSVISQVLSEDMDIIEPGVMHANEQRSTEDLVRDNNFRRLSASSVAVSEASTIACEADRRAHGQDGRQDGREKWI